MPRYANKHIFTNNIPFYDFLFKKRGIRQAVQYDIAPMHNPTVRQRGALRTTTHIWKYGDRYYKLSQDYYGTPSYWWVIAWYNGRPTEADIGTGTMLSIPLDLELALQTLKAY